MIRKSAWLISAGLTVLATPSFAQTAQSNTDTDKQAAQPTPGAAEGAAVQDQAREQQPTDTGDIVITATRRNEALSDVPMAVSAVTGKSLEYSGASDIRQLNQLSPSLLVSSTSSEAGAAVARIRGIGTVGDNPGLEGSVGVFIDGVYRSRAGMGLTELGPIDRIEVLRGPQGTLFGRNTSAGLISVITAKPRFTPEASGQIDVGNFDLRRVELSVTGPLSSTVAARFDAVYLKRDGFLKDVISGRDLNDRNRALLRGQILYQPSDNFSFRVIGDATKRREECCGAVYLPMYDYTAAGFQPSTVRQILTGLGGIVTDDPEKRKTSITPGRNYNSDVNDWGLSAEAVYDVGGAELTSITAYRFNKYLRGQDADFNNLDILFRDNDGGSFNRFKTFTQELRLQGNAFNNHLDWLIGGYYANENLEVRDNLKYGADYNRYVNCLAAYKIGYGLFNAGLAGQAPGVPNGSALPNTANPASCMNTPTAIQIATSPLVPASVRGAVGLLAGLNPATPGYAGYGALARVLQLSLGLPTTPVLNGVGLDDDYHQTSDNWAFFTHNIFSITDDLKFTAGLRYTHETKTLKATLTDNNNFCRALQTAAGVPVPSVAGLAALQLLPCVIPSVPGGFFTDASSKSENKLSGTAVLSWKPTPELLTYVSYSRGYKAGGYNLDRSAFPRLVVGDPADPAVGGVLPTARLDDLEFKPETNDAVEAGLKYNGHGIDVNFAVFNQLFKNFQLNAFNGVNFEVVNINSCSQDLNGADSDGSNLTGACTGDTRAGVRSRGAELEIFARPMRDLSVNLGGVLVNTKYRDNLVGADGRPLAPNFFQLPGQRISNSSEFTATGSIAWTPPIGGSGMRALVYADMRHTSSLNTGSDLDIEKLQDAFNVVNARIGIHGPDEVWGIEIWAQNLFDKTYMQVGFDAPLQGYGTGVYSNTKRGVDEGKYLRSNQAFGAFLGEPRTFGVTLRGKLGFHRPPPPAYVPPPAPPPVVEQPAPPPPPPPAPERG